MNTFLVLTLLMLGGLTVLVLRRPSQWAMARFKDRAPIIKKYWAFIIPYVILNIVAYVLVTIYSYNDISFNILGQISAMILAIFIGNIAFAEFGESKFDKLTESALSAGRRYEFTTAKNKYEEANSLKPKDPNLLGNLLEVYLMLGLFDEFDTKIRMHEKYAIEIGDKLANTYLSTLRSLAAEHMRDARNKIQKTIEFTNENPTSRERFNWVTDEFTARDTYRTMGETTRRMTSNYFAYLKRQLTPDQEKRFVEGSYEDVGPAIDPSPGNLSLNLEG